MSDGNVVLDGNLACAQCGKRAEHFPYNSKEFGAVQRSCDCNFDGGIVSLNVEASRDKRQGFTSGDGTFVQIFLPIEETP